MSRFIKHAQLGFRWVKCGWRLFRRNPWLLAGMGFCSTVLVTILAFIPFLGTPLIGLIAPSLLASLFLALDRTTQQKLKLPPGLRIAALKQSPRELVSIFRDENRVMQTLMIGLFCMIIVVVTDIMAWMFVGATWANRSELYATGFVRVALATVLTLTVYAATVALFAYTLPLALLRKEPIVPAMTRSFKTSLHYGFALAILIGFLLSPFFLAAATASFSVPLSYAIGLCGGAVTLPIVAGSFYCSYRTLFTAPDAATATRVMPKNPRVHAA